jgi:hypothetical protein
MRATWISALVGAGILASATSASAQAYGNDTGGIIPWSCEHEAAARAIAGDYCARFDKYARITSVRRQYGDYIGFQCLWNPRIARYAVPAVGTRSACYTVRTIPRRVVLK